MPSLTISKRYINVFVVAILLILTTCVYWASNDPQSDFYSPTKSTSPLNSDDDFFITTVRSADTDGTISTLRGQEIKKGDATLILEQKVACRILPEFTSKTGRSAKITLKNAHFQMMVFKENDIVSQQISGSGMWEGPLVERILSKLKLVSDARGVEKSIFMDIGANIGWFSMAIGSQKYKVIAFEPMPQNEALFRSSLCMNPEINTRVRYYTLGLGKAPDTCDIWSHNINVGDGHVACGNAVIPGVTDNKEYSLRSTINVRKLDDVMGTDHLDDIAVIKIDVEGFEANVFEGALKWLELAQPPFIVSEFAPGMLKQKNTDPIELLKTFDRIGYDISQNSWEGPLLTTSRFAAFINEAGLNEVYLTSRKWKKVN